MGTAAPLPPLVEPADTLTGEEVARYSRQLIIPDLGVEGQKRLKNARVLVIGAGGLGSPTLLYLAAAAGVGTIGIVEDDVRSAAVLATLKAVGFTNVRHLGGGIAAWAGQLEPDMVMY